MEGKHPVGAWGSGFMTNLGPPILLTKPKTCSLSQAMLTAAQLESLAARKRATGTQGLCDYDSLDPQTSTRCTELRRAKRRSLS
jgi:hypothetical protein